MSDDDKRINDESSGSDSSDDDDVRAVDTTNVDAGLFSSDEDEDGSDAGVQQENVKYVDEHVVIPFADWPERSSVDPSKFEMLVAHLPATIDVIPEPFAHTSCGGGSQPSSIFDKQKRYTRPGGTRDENLHFLSLQLPLERVVAAGALVVNAT